ncbi:MAG: response regulator [Spirochaetota bacterium]
MPGKKILVVDDDQVVLHSCKVVLEAEGFQVHLVPSAREAIAFLESRYVDLMIMDVKMPEKDGLYILDVIREKWPLDRWPELPVLVMSGYPTPDTINDLIKRGVREFISKPFTPDELIESVRKTLTKKEKKT